MSGLEWNDELKLELLRLKAEINPQSLKVLSKGIGIGNIKSVKANNPIFEEETKRHMRVAKATVSNSQRPSYTMPLKPSEQAPIPTPRYIEQAANIQKGRGFRLFFQSHLLDILFILFSITVGVLFLGIIFDRQHLSAGHWDQWFPLRLVEGVSLVSAAAIVYGLFGIYFLFFRLAMGMTLGESMFFPPKKVEKKPSGWAG
ncbi:hypothetical protein [Pseudobacteriovorax antillogorgiicola]|uniref:Uncharacterized protein n=1 Tax=Pseudobacteriovorax antillogorgiicola TaxID=1513793 RepID=A0A1Y6BAS8_9BACT|nr:hypothetical protein [Pseudobacteriovorax antillogorgiicola]TCS58808.1 hypothetical protein EDD56_102323 [Pseudobacteriovorax antillogorgiicola]SME94485.1 hypothetical protein SAMN06296036_102120 [Pseudobacteriovorax antillogorgiicola]